MKKLIALLAALALLMPATASARASHALPSSDAISHGKINKVTYLYWGKSEMYPTLALVGPGEEFDVYEFDKNWVMVLYDTTVTQGYSGSPQSFYCYVKRADITCDPALDGDESAKADTGPGKRPGKKPKPKPSAGASAGATDAASPAPSDEATAEPEPTVEEQEEYDWIIRTPGMCNVTMNVEGLEFTCSFALMAQKVGGTAPSSDPIYNHNMHTPYAATAFFGLVAPMQSLLESMNVSQFLTGTGGAEITAQAPSATFFLDTGAADPALVNFTIPMTGKGTLNPKITGDNIEGHFEMTMDMPMQLPVQLKKAGSGYQFVLKGMKPGGGDLTFPAVLEKTFSDPDYWDKQARDADRRRKAAEDLMKKMSDELAKQLEDEYKKNKDGTGKDGTASTDPLTVPGENGKDIPLAPLVTEDPLAPLVTEDPLAPLVTEDPLAPLVTEDPLAPLVPQPGEGAGDFPHGK